MDVSFFETMPYYVTSPAIPDIDEQLPAPVPFSPPVSSPDPKPTPPPIPGILHQAENFCFALK